MLIKKILLTSLVVASLFIVSAKVFSVDVPSLLQSTSIVTWNEAGQAKQVNETAWYFFRRGDQSSTLQRRSQHPTLDDTSTIGCVKNTNPADPNNIIKIKFPDSQNPDQKEFYQLIANDGGPDGNLRYNVVEASWDSGKQNNCEYGYIYYFGANKPTYVEVNGDVYAAGEIEGYSAGKNYILMAGRHLIESSDQLTGMDTSDYDVPIRVGLYQFGDQQDPQVEYLKNIQQFSNQISSLKNSSSRVQKHGSGTFKNANSLLSELKKDTKLTDYPLGEVYVFEGDLTIDQPIDLDPKANKLVIVENDRHGNGSINIESDIRGSGALALVAENGKITVSGDVTQNGSNYVTSVTTLNAALISLKDNRNDSDPTNDDEPTIEIADFTQSNAGWLDIHGLLIGGQIDFLRDPAKLATGNAAVVLTYMPNLAKVPGFVKLIKPSVEEATP